MLQQLFIKIRYRGSPHFVISQFLIPAIWWFYFVPHFMILKKDNHFFFIFLFIIFCLYTVIMIWWILKSKLHDKKTQKVDFRNFLDPFWGFPLKTVLGIHDPHISWLLFGTKNHEIGGPLVHANKGSKKILADSLSWLLPQLLNSESIF